MFFDLDEFKGINDTYGHRAGDALLIRVAGEISALVRRNEVFARLGGDEFAILVPNMTGNEAEVLAERVVRAIAQIPFRFEGQNLRVTTSLGIAYYPTHAADADDLVARADIAMYQAKDAGKNTWRVFRADNVADSEMRHRLSWSERISNALDKDLLVLHFQGIYRADGGALSHLEALVRMRDEHDPISSSCPPTSSSWRKRTAASLTSTTGSCARPCAGWRTIRRSRRWRSTCRGARCPSPPCRTSSARPCANPALRPVA
jgi:diguanylate cyclase (GGDEF)-like protein